MPLLARPLPLRADPVQDRGPILIEDTERFCRKVLHDYATSTGSHYQADDEDDAISYLLGIVWRLPALYDSKPRDVSFSTYAYRILSVRCVSELRDRAGRTRWQFGTHTYERERPTILHLDQPQADDHTRTLGETLAVLDSRLEADRDSTVEWLEQSRDREAANDKRILADPLAQPNAA